jgi:TctA family transporter
MFFSFLGWFMKRFGWPRPPLILGLVLSGIIENYLFISISRYGAAWLTRPVVLIIGLLIIGSMIYGFRAARSAQQAQVEVTD